MESNFSLSWESYQTNICNGLSALQQNGELVDMTLAADGHYVKVHQLVMSLVSPYIKDLIASAKCPHPVIFLNDVSYRTLLSLLEYIYTGEVHVTKENLVDVIKAAKALHINGLMDIEDLDYSSIFNEEGQASNVERRSIRIKKKDETTNYSDIYNDSSDDIGNTSQADDDLKMDYHSINVPKQPVEPHNSSKGVSLQYTASNRGNIQMILNRFMYHLRYSGKNTPHRRWQCVDHETPNRCNACIITSGDTLVKRLGAHTHPFHDRKILRKTQTSKIYSTIKEAEVTREK